MNIEHMHPAVPGLSGAQIRKAVEWLDRGTNRATFCERNMIEPTDSTAWIVWMLAVDQIITRMVGLGAMDLPDWGYRDAFDDGVSPGSAARQAIRYAEEG